MDDSNTTTTPNKTEAMEVSHTNSGSEGVLEECGVEVCSTRDSGNGSDSSPVNANTSNTDSRTFFIVKNTPTSTTSTTTVLDVEEEEEPAGIKLRRQDVPNHSMPTTQQTSSTSFFQRLRSTRQLLGHRANDVWNAATPALSMAGQAVKTAATHAAVVASSTYETYEATTINTSSNAKISSSASTNNPYDNDKDHPSSSSAPSSPSSPPAIENEKDNEPIVPLRTLTPASERIHTNASTTASISSSSTSFRGRYSLLAPSDKTAASDQTPTKGTKTSNSLLQQALGIPLKQQQHHHQRPPQSSTTTARRLQHVRPTFIRSSSGGLLPPPISPFHHESPASGGIRSQTALILQSSAGPHMQSILSSLEPWEHVMLLGPGIMGVNLKDSYHGGVYVDYCVPNGNAEKSGVVHIGDVLVKVGEVNVRKLSIKEVPGIIANQPRPTIIVLSRKHLYPSEQDTNPLDRALATILDIQTRVKEERERSIASMPLTDTSAATTSVHSDAASAAESDYYDNDDDLDDSITPNHEDTSILEDHQSGGDYDTDEDQSIVSSGNASTTIPSDSSYFTTPRSSNTTSSATARVPKSVQRSLAAYASRQHLEMSFYSAIKRAHGSMDPKFCQTMKDGLRALCADARCLPFFASHLTKHEALYENNTSRHANSNSDGTTTTTTTYTSTNTARLMLLLEALAFYELWPVIPPHRRWHHASRVAQKFLLTDDHPVSHIRSDIPRQIVEDIEQTLTLHRQDIPRDIFIPVQNHMEQVFCGMHFASFIMGEHFARMRAYISGSPYYADVPLEVVIHQSSSRLLQDTDSTSSKDAQNYMQYMMVHLVSSEANRGAGLAAALFLKRLFRYSETTNDRLQLLQYYSQLWNVYLSPTGGTLSTYHKNMSKDTADALMRARDDVWSTLITTESNSQDDKDQIPSETVKESLHKLAEELIYEYAANVYPRFKMDRLHDLLFREVVDYQPKTQGPPLLAKGSISRLLRSAKFPRSISTHRPHRSAMVPTATANNDASKSNDVNAEFAVVFGSDPNRATAIRRYCAVQVGNVSPQTNPLDECSDVITVPLPPRVQSVEELPAALEDYAALNPGRFIKRPLENSQQIGARSEDGWDIFISNFTIPHASADHPTNCLHGVSLILHRSSPSDVHPATGAEEPTLSQSNPDSMFRAIAVEGAERYLTFDIVHKVDQIFKEAPSPSRRHRSVPCSKQSLEGGYTVGISLVANHNVIPAMRQSLCHFLKGTSSRETTGVRVAPLADLLGCLSSPENKGNSIDLQSLLRPYLESGSKEWIDRPLYDQAKWFEDQCIQNLLKCLSPTAFGLAFLTVLLEQKVIFVSSRRTILLSAVTALCKLITPLEWPHLSVPTVPSHIAVNLIHYPVPFLIGLCSHDKDNQEISNVPKDVTVVDLDLGRVVLGEKYASSGDSKESSSELRLQVINLAEELGAHLGTLITPDVWRCEDPLYVSGGVGQSVMCDAGESVRSFCHDFITELTAGVDSCCVWIEEADSGSKQESMVLFDEERFFHLKDLRSKNTQSPLMISKDGGNAVGKFAIGLDEFDLILETLLRGQAMSAFISSRTKESMTYW